MAHEGSSPSARTMFAGSHFPGAVKHRVLSLISSGDMVVVVDSAGAERTVRVCEIVGFKRGPTKA